MIQIVCAPKSNKDVDYETPTIRAIQMEKTASRRRDIGILRNVANDGAKALKTELFASGEGHSAKEI